MRTTIVLDDDLFAKSQKYTRRAYPSRSIAPRCAPRRNRARLQGPAALAAGQGTIIADTSIWADRIRARDEAVSGLLDVGALLHPFVLAEIALGNPPRRAVTLATLGAIRPPVVASNTEVRRLIEKHAMFGSGVGYVDAHLIASTMLTAGAKLWTGDRQAPARCRNEIGPFRKLTATAENHLYSSAQVRAACRRRGSQRRPAS